MKNLFLRRCKRNTCLQRKNSFHIIWQCDFFSQHHWRLLWLVGSPRCEPHQWVRTLHHCVAVSACSSAPSALQTRAELAIKCDKKKHPIWPSRSRIKGSCCCGFHRLHSTIHLLLREEKRNERLEGTDLQADVTEDILYCCTHTETLPAQHRHTVIYIK